MQSSHIWYRTFKNFVIEIEFVASSVYRGPFVLPDNNQGIGVAAVVLYVDDLLAIAIQGLIGQIKDQVKKRFRMDDLGSVSFSLSMNIEHNREHHTSDIH